MKKVTGPKVAALAAMLSLGISNLAFAQTMDNSTNGSTNATSGNNAMSSTMGNAPMGNTGTTGSPPMGSGSMGSGSMDSNSMGSGSMGTNSGMAGSSMNGSTASTATTPSTMGSPGSSGTVATTAPAMGNSMTTNTQATVMPQPGSGATVPTMSGKAAGNMPLKGSNSFTEKQAERRLAKQGYTNVAGLAKDSSGVWRGTATNKSSQSVSVALDYKGRITETQ